jgi:hypothetical protein
MHELFWGALGGVLGNYIYYCVVPFMISIALAMWMRFKEKWSWPGSFILSFIVWCICIVLSLIIIGKILPQNPDKLPITKPSMRENGKLQQPATSLSLKSLSPEDISKAIDSAPLLQQPEIAKHYIGIKVLWEGKLFGSWKHEGDNNVTIDLNRSFAGRSIVFEVNPSNYRGLELLKEGAPIKIEGVIDKIETGYIKLKDVKIILY